MSSRYSDTMAKDIRFWFGIALLGLAVLFTLQNVAVVEVSFLFWTITLPRAILLFVIFAAGAIFGWVFGRLHPPNHDRQP